MEGAEAKAGSELANAMQRATLVRSRELNLILGEG